MRRLGQPDELNGLAVFLASDASAFVTGSNIMCDVSLFLLYITNEVTMVLMRIILQGGYSCY